MRSCAAGNEEDRWVFMESGDRQGSGQLISPEPGAADGVALVRDVRAPRSKSGGPR